MSLKKLSLKEIILSIIHTLLKKNQELLYLVYMLYIDHAFRFFFLFMCKYAFNETGFHHTNVSH